MGNWRIPDYLEEFEGLLHINGVNAHRLANQFGTPLFVFSEGRIRQNCDEVRESFQQWAYKTQVYYASKANSNLTVLSVIRDAGLNVEVNSGGELYKALEVGFFPEQIIFNGVAKTDQELHEAISQAIFCINVDSVYELSRIIEIATNLKTRANIALRIVPDVKTGAHGGLETGTDATKFGISDHEILDACQMALQEKYINLLGLHMHIGAQTVHSEAFRSGFESLLLRAAECYKYNGNKPFSILNIGGGIPVSFIRPGDVTFQRATAENSNVAMGNLHEMLQTGLSPADVARETIGRLAAGDYRELLDQAAPGFHETLKDTHFLIEPGSRIMADTAVLLTRVNNHKIRSNGQDHWLLLDAGFNTLLDTFSYNWYFQVGSVNRAADPQDALYRLGGPLCDSGDIYHDSEMLGRLPDYYALPANIVPGDILVFFDVGAYTLEQMCQYNGQLRAAAIIIKLDGDVTLIRRRDNYLDLISQDILI